MKSAVLALTCLVLAAPMARAGARLIPAGALIQCTVSEPRLNSKTTAVGDPVLCQAGFSGGRGSFSLPYETYLVGRFQDYKDPGHFVGKGWMELTFDHMVVEPDTVVPLNAKVIGVPGYNIDREGRILGKGHRVRDTVEWMIPILWPIDVLNLPRRGPRPTLKSETRLTLKVMDDFAVPDGQPLQQDPSGLYRRTPSSYMVPQQSAPQIAPAVMDESSAPPVPQPVAVEPASAVRQYRPAYVRTTPPAAADGYYPPTAADGYYYIPPRPVYVSPYSQAWSPRTVIMVRNGVAYQIYGP